MTVDPTLVEVVRYDRWANAKVFEICLGVDRARLDEPAAGTYGTILRSLVHMVSVEEVFAGLIDGRDRPPHPAAAARDAFARLMVERGVADGYFKHELGWYGERVVSIADEWEALLSATDAGDLEKRLFVPWFGVELSLRQVILQATGHAAHHRSQVLSTLGDRGVEVPDIDYVIMLAMESK